MSQIIKRGAFILFEGVDRCGKTTQTGKLVEFLRAQNISCEHMRFPDRTTEIGKIINAYLTNQTNLQDESIHLLYSVNRWEAKETIENHLKAGKTIVMDRYAYSGVAFSAAKGLSLQWCKNPDEGLPAPDLVIFMDLDIEESKKRGDFGAERYEKEEFQKKVRTIFHQLKSDAWKVLDARQSIDELHTQIQHLALEAINSYADKPIQHLWH
jgi:dTMP kinase